LVIREKKDQHEDVQTGIDCLKRISFLGDVQNPTGHGPQPPDLARPALGRMFDKTTSIGPFQSL